MTVTAAVRDLISANCKHFTSLAIPHGLSPSDTKNFHTLKQKPA